MCGPRSKNPDPPWTLSSKGTNIRIFVCLEKGSFVPFRLFVSEKYAMKPNNNGHPRDW